MRGYLSAFCLRAAVIAATSTAVLVAFAAGPVPGSLIGFPATAALDAFCALWLPEVRFF